MEETAIDLNRIRAAAIAQKGVLCCVLANLFWPVFPPIFLLILPFQVVFVYRLAKLVEIGYPPIWAVGMFIPFLNLLLLLLLARQSSQYIREAGFQVGFAGASMKEINAAIERGVPDAGNS